MSKFKNELQQELASAREVIADQKTRIEKHEKEISRLKSQTEMLDQLKKSLANLDGIEDNGKTLKKLLASSEDKLSGLIQQVDKESKAADTRQIAISEKFRQLEKKLEALQAQLELLESPKMALPNAISDSKTAFRIDMYLRQGHYHGKIEHILTRKEKKFQGLDPKAILDFMSQYLSKLKTADIPTPSKVDTDIDVKDQGESEKAEITADDSEMPSLNKFKVYEPGASIPTMLIFKDKIVKLRAMLRCDHMNISSEDPLTYKIMICAHSLEDRTEHLLGEVDGQMSSASSSKIKVNCRVHKSGTYRLKAYASFFRPKISTATPRFKNIYRGILLDVH